MRQTHKIKDSVQYKKYLREAVPECSADPIANDGYLTDETSDEEEQKYKDFKNTLRSNMDEVRRIEARKKISINDPDEDPYDDEDPDWFVEETSKMIIYKDRRRKRVQEAGKHS